MLNRIVKYSVFILLPALILGGANAWAIRINIYDAWSLTITQSDLQGWAGSDLDNTYESAANESNLRVRRTNGARWKVEVMRVGNAWPADVHVYVKRTGDGTGPNTGYISGGTSYLEITGTWQEFYAGKKNRRAVPLQFKVEGVSIQVPADTYTTAVTYRVTTQ